ncbi:MAG TPA: hypothetical protein PK054_12625 [Anaerohalosphaeraceae bacterium]|nr:hypothetical protein [Anaerohalosphaeraceae bacterium]HOL90005.1 hypothetical protein [Anaerohalosphaeraceae bacterium]HPP57410.1 hypothetical protein [Anaerohalosphaeraceae bacterium]
MRDTVVRVQSLGPTENVVVVRFVGTPVAISQGQILSQYLANGADDEVCVLTANLPFGGVAAESYTVDDVARTGLVKVYRGAGVICNAKVSASSQAVVVGDQLIPDVSEAGLKAVNFAGAATGIAAIALEAYPTGSAANMKVMLTGQYSACIA